MTKIRLLLNAVAVIAVCLIFSSLANAQATRTWVSGVGDDVNPCSRTAPCKTFSGAISKTFINGEIDALDPAGYGTVTITKSMTIDGGQGSGFASILSSGVTGVNINLTDNSGNDPLKTVRLRNLSINGTGASGTVGTRTGINGIRIILATGSVFVENVVISDFTNRGISDERTTGGKLFVTDSIIRNNGGSGIVILPASSGTTTIHATLDNVRLDGNVLAGISVSNGSRVSMKNCIASGNALAGFFSEGPLAASELNLESCLASNNGTGLSVNAGSTMRISNVHVSDNTTGVANTGTIGTYNNNRIAGNTGGNAHPLPGAVVSIPVQ